MNCEDCRFFETDAHEHSGFCHRNPPFPTPMPDPHDGRLYITQYLHVTTTHTNWCGEWKEIET